MRERASRPSTPASAKMPTVTSKSASQVSSTSASATAIVAKPKPSAKSASSPAASPRPAPAPSAPALRFSSRLASSSSSRASVLACSATCFAAPPTPCFSLAPRVGMSPPVDQLREHRADAEGHSGDDERIGPALRALRLPPAQLGAAGAPSRPGAGLGILRRLALRARDDQGGLQLAEEVGVVRELVGQLARDAALRRGLAGQRLELVGAALDDPVALVAHRLAGGFSPVATRQIPDAVRLATIVAAAPRAP